MICNLLNSLLSRLNQELKKSLKVRKWKPNTSKCAIIGINIDKFQNGSWMRKIICKMVQLMRRYLKIFNNTQFILKYYIHIFIKIKIMLMDRIAQMLPQWIIFSSNISYLGSSLTSLSFSKNQIKWPEKVVVSTKHSNIKQISNWLIVVSEFINIIIDFSYFQYNFKTLLSY